MKKLNPRRSTQWEEPKNHNPNKVSGPKSPTLATCESRFDAGEDPLRPPVSKIISCPDAIPWIVFLTSLLIDHVPCNLLAYILQILGMSIDVSGVGETWR
jgi:hypothetical protein